MATNHGRGAECLLLQFLAKNGLIIYLGADVPDTLEATKPPHRTDIK